MPSDSLHYPGDNTYEHARRLKLESNFSRPKNNPVDNFFKKLDKEILLASSFGVKQEDYGEVAKGLFGERVDTDNVTEEQNAQIQGAYLGFHIGWKSGLDKFFKERKADK